MTSSNTPKRRPPPTTVVDSPRPSKLYQEGLSLKYDNLVVFKRDMHTADDVALFIKFAKDRIKNLCILLNKRLKGEILFEQEKTSGNCIPSLLFLERYTQNIILPFMKCISYSKDILLDKHFVLLLKFCAIVLQDSAICPHQIISDLCYQLAKVDYMDVFENCALLLENLLHTCLYSKSYNLAEVVISEMIRTITFKREKLRSQDNFILGRLNLFWYACDPRSQKARDRIAAARKHLNDVRISQSRESNTPDQMKQEVKRAITLLISVEKMKDTASVLKLMLEDRFSELVRSRTTVVRAVEPPAGFTSDLLQIELNLKKCVSKHVSEKKTVTEILKPTTSTIEHSKQQQQEELIERDKDNNFQGEYNEYLHVYDAQKIKRKKRKEYNALDEIAHKRALKKARLEGKSPCKPLLDE